MSGNRQAATNFILKYIDKIMPDGTNKKTYADFFSGMSDQEFDQFMNGLETGEKFLTITAPNFAKVKLNVDRNLEIAEELGHNFFPQIWIGSHDGQPTYLSPIPYLVVDLPLRRASQSLIKKIKVAEDNKTVDTLTNQATGKSKGARVSFPELQVLAAMNLDNSIIELMKYRGGDARGFNAMNNMIAKQGTAVMKTLSSYASGVESTRTLKTFLTCMHLKSTL